MKNTIYFLGIILAMFCQISCTRTGSGNVLTEMRRVNNFDKIKVVGIQTLIINQSDNYKVKLTADDNVISNVLTYERDGCLVVEYLKNITKTDIEVVVELPILRKLDVYGKVRTEISNPIELNDLRILLDGNGSIKISNIISDGRVIVNSRGSGIINLGGECQQLSFKNEGSGSVFAESMKSNEIIARILGSGSIFATVSGPLSVLIEGSGSFIYSGKPTKISKQIKGSGCIQSRN